MPDNSNILSSDEESIHSCESHDESHDETPIVEKPKEKKQKLTFEEYVEQHQLEFDKFKTYFDEVSMKDFNKGFNKFFKAQEVFMSKLVKIHQKSSTRKKRIPTANTGKSGFNKPSPVPKAFLKYLSLEDDTEMTRPQLVKMLNKKFIDDGFKKESQVCISDKKVAKMFDVEKNYNFHAKDYHKFIATYYNNAKSSNA